MALTGRAALLALLGVLPVLLVPSVWTVVAVAVVLLVLVLVDVARAAPVGSLRLSRAGATACRLGEQAEVTLSLVNPGPRRLRGALRDAWVPSAGAGPRTHELDVPAGQRRVLTTVLEPTRRGDRLPDRVTVRSVGPLGVAARQGRHELPWRVRVQPPFTSRKHLPERLARLRQLDGAVAVRQRGQGTEFDTLRDYVEGDDVRAIDWRATARRQDVVVRTWRPERDRTLLLVVDTSRTSAGRVGDVPRLDAALDAALLLGALASRAGDRVDLLAFDRVPRATVEGAGREDLLRRMVDAMAGLEPALVESDGRRLVGEVLRRTRRRSLVVLFTSLDTAPLEEGLLPHLASLTSRHTVVLAAVADPRVEQMAAGGGTPEAVYDAAAAERARTERRRLTALLRRRGVEVVDAPPEHFAPAVSDAYLSLKAAGRLSSERLLLERLSADAWPPLEQVDVDGWRLRAAAGVTRRGNSALPLTDARPLAEVLDFYRARGLPAAVQVSDPALDAELDALGWSAEMPTDVMHGPLVTSGGADLDDRPGEDWLGCWWAVDGRGGAAELDVARRCLARVRAPAAYASVREDDATVAVARGVVQAHRLGVFAMAVLPGHRRRGHARALLGALGAWADGLGATSAYLQVRRDNPAAVALYRSCGMTTAYGYSYRYGPGA